MAASIFSSGAAMTVAAMTAKAEVMRAVKRILEDQQVFLMEKEELLTKNCLLSDGSGRGGRTRGHDLYATLALG
jgi:hypothetical protein